jgi:hypothetical protein
MELGFGWGHDRRRGGVTWQSHGAPFNGTAAIGEQYLISKNSNRALWGPAPNASTQSNIGIKGNQPFAPGWAFLFDLEAGFDPYSLKFANGPGSIAQNAGVPLNSLVATRIGSIRRVICGSPAYFAERGIPKRPDDPAAHSCVTFEGLMSPDAWTFTTGKSEMSIAIHSRLVVNTAEAAIDAAIAGIGITRVLSYQIANAVQSGVLVVALGEFEPAPSPVSLVYAGGRFPPLKLRASLDFAAPRLKARLVESAS